MHQPSPRASIRANRMVGRNKGAGVAPPTRTGGRLAAHLCFWCAVKSITVTANPATKPAAAVLMR